MKKRILLLLLSGSIVHHLDVVSMEQQDEARKAEKKRKREAEEPEKEQERPEGEPKRQRQEVPSLLQLTGLSVIEQQVGLKEINDFLQVKNEKEAQELQKKYEELPLDVKEKIKEMVNAPLPGNSMKLTPLHRATTVLQVRQLFFLGARYDYYGASSDRTLARETPLITMLRNGYNGAALEFLQQVMDQRFSGDEHKKDVIEGMLIQEDIGGIKPLQYAVLANAVDVIEMLMKNSVVEEFIDDKMGNPDKSLLAYAVTYSPDSIPLLVDHGADVNNSKGVLFEAARYGTLKTVKELIKFGMTIERNYPNGENILFYSCGNKDPEVLKFFLEKYSNLNVNQVSQSNETPLIFLFNRFMAPTVASINLAKVKLLVEHGANVNFVGKAYPLAVAIFVIYPSIDLRRSNDIDYDVVKYLVSKGAKLKQKDHKIIMQSDNQELKDALKGVELFSVA